MEIDQPPEPNLEDPDWHFPILEWLVEGKLPSDQIEARHITRQAKAFFLIDGELYKQGAAGILMRCILEDQGRSYFARSTPARSSIMPVRGLLSGKLLDKVSIGL
jgi:hypothetical protein